MDGGPAASTGVESVRTAGFCGDTIMGDIRAAEPQRLRFRTPETIRCKSSPICRLIDRGRL
jgi:hypothetical protein